MTAWRTSCAILGVDLHAINRIAAEGRAQLVPQMQELLDEMRSVEADAERREVSTGRIGVRQLLQAS
jgi:hypothetical protein